MEGLVLGLPFALLMGILAGLLEFFPSIGHGIWLVIASLLALILGSTWIPVQNWVFLIIVLSFHLVFTQFDLNSSYSSNHRSFGALTTAGCYYWYHRRGFICRGSWCSLSRTNDCLFKVLGGYLYARIFDLEPFQDRLTTVPPLPPPEIRWWQKSHAIKPVIEDKE